MRKTIISAAIIIISALTITACQSGPSGADHNVVMTMDTIIADGVAIHMETMPVEGGWGYIIALNGRKMIAQDVIPVLEGNYQFRTSADAYRIGQVAVRKMSMHAGLPTIYMEDLVEAGIVDASGNLK